jgi:geranylgeranyl pyrophosphate synthase
LLPREAVNLKEEIRKPRILIHMNSESQLMKKVKDTIEKKGRAAIEQARQEISDSPYDGGAVSSAVKYFAQVTLQRGLPVFPALISLSCEAVGRRTEKTRSIGTALTLIAGAADVHDDIIDQSATKYSKKTVFGKFGSDVALLAGDALLMQGLMLLHVECESLPKNQRKAILSLMPSTLFEISNAEAQETHLMRKLDTTSQEYFEVIRLKGVVPETHCKIGAILGNANKASVEALGNYGRTFGIASLVRDEFIDLYEYPELQNRIKNECLPLPMLHALQNSAIKKEIKAYIESTNPTRRELNRIRKLVLGSEQVKLLKRNLEFAVKEGLKQLTIVGSNAPLKQLELLLRATTRSM